MKAFAVIVFLLGNAMHRVNGTFLPRPYPQTTTTSVIAVVGLARGGGGGGNGRDMVQKKNAAVKEQPSSSSLQSMKETFMRLRSLPAYSNGSTTALCQSLILFVGAMFAVISVNKIRDLFPQESVFLIGKGRNSNNRQSAMALCLEVPTKSILYAWPGSISEALSADPNGIVAKVCGSYLSFTAVLVLVSQLGRPSAFPIKAGHIGGIFNIMRMFAPVMATFFIPLESSLGPNKQKLSPSNWNRDNYHTLTAFVSFIFAPLLELISSFLDMIKFFEQDPSKNKLFPSDIKDYDESMTKESSTTSLVDKFYKYLWVGLTLARGAIACACLYCVYSLVTGGLRMDSRYPAVDTCSVLQNIKAFVDECSVTGLVGIMYGVLALSQMCESSGRQLSSLIYILPLMAFLIKHARTTFSILFLSFDMKKNYLNIVNMPDGRFSEKLQGVMTSFLQFYSEQNPEAVVGDQLDQFASTYTAKFSDAEMDSIRDKCFTAKKVVP
mmetsp:Transcript_4977/g.5508  ORF Transcript_4977/g.5508 Transcript_4977/m.5508 type:complete len:495 (-) Transcript_4977:1755-3239(-)